MADPSDARNALVKAVEAVDRGKGWDKLPTPLGLLALIGLRDELRQRNLYDTYAGSPPSAPAGSPTNLTARTVDGSYNDLSAPSMGMAGTRFGRNVPPERFTAEDVSRLLDPNPRTVSTELLVRREFKPAPTLNVLAAAWLQFQIRDWFSHGSDPNRMIDVPRPSNDDWPDDPMQVPSTPHDPTSAPDQEATTFINTETHWWDAPDVRQHPRVPAGGAHRRGRQASDRSRRAHRH
jgi:hypothetical protein